MKITIGVPVMNLHELTMEFLDLIFKNTNQIDEILLVDNGSQPHILEYIYQNRYKYFRSGKIATIRNIQNVGVRESLNQIQKTAHGDIICYTHNDVDFLEKGWDDKIREAFKKYPDAGIIGAYGAKGLAVPDIYQTPYEFTQLIRAENVSDCPMDKEVHGFRNIHGAFENVTMFDGFMFCIKKKLLDEIGGFNGKVLESHHMYDAFICIESLKKGYENIVIPLGLYHQGGATDVSQDWASVFGKSKQQVHQDAHPLFYEYGRGILPVLVEDIYNEEENKIIGYNLYMNRQLVKTKMYE